ncbi:unnamed protein product [Didymodactylos carnosus]|uniref:Uncharacterized protein n=1 Tax=Didymodactylos carnosus TaxID=1234261 RepID=A0A815DR19_9BILA|nr:unnamed protein product [Didymodactylos carnosus]CAF4124648.1 unnamed protein product [Didymodactylos carnosus]
MSLRRTSLCGHSEGRPSLASVIEFNQPPLVGTYDLNRVSLEISREFLFLLAELNFQADDRFKFSDLHEKALESAIETLKVKHQQRIIRLKTTKNQDCNVYVEIKLNYVYRRKTDMVEISGTLIEKDTTLPLTTINRKSTIQVEPTRRRNPIRFKLLRKYLCIPHHRTTMSPPPSP